MNNKTNNTDAFVKKKKEQYDSEKDNMVLRHVVMNVASYMSGFVQSQATLVMDDLKDKAIDIAKSINNMYISKKKKVYKGICFDMFFL